jgi:pantoate--beta-alanine ligase
MILIRSAHRMAALSWRLRRQGNRLGVVPTMGALHEGHLSLIRAAAAGNDIVIVTIFVNPLQFGPREDFRRYPRHLRRDLRLARRAGADIVFAPGVREMYPKGFKTRLAVGPVGDCWEARARPGYFSGVATVVAILFQLTRPTTAYFGQKDYQQTLVVRRLVSDLRLPVRLNVRPTVREPGGLAMSSRNQYLGPSQRRSATVLYRALRAAAAQVRAGERHSMPVVQAMRHLIRSADGVRLDYAAIVDAKTLKPQRYLHGRVAMLVAATVGRTRLIDNLLVDVS